jgi:pimeloyl-ACP methyl ester carboxylesterase
MPRLRVNGAELYYEDTGPGGEAVLFVPGLAWGTLLFRAQVAALEGRYRCVVVEPRGQGRSEVTKGGYELDNVALDASALIDHLGLAPCHLVGHSLGGSVAVRVAARRPEAVRSFAMLDGTADEDPIWDRVLFRGLSYLVQTFGMGRVDARLVETMFGETFLNDPSRVRQREEARNQFLSNDGTGVARAVRGWLRSPPVMKELPKVTAPALVVAGEEDAVVKPERSRKVAEGVRDGRFLLLPRCGHSSPFECPGQVNAALVELFERAAVHEPHPAGAP